jgi:hypothetical protein
MFISCAVVGKEPKRYKHFVNAFNQALELMRPLAIPGIRGSDEIDILFHRCDPVIIEAQHVNPDFVSQRKPDVIITSLAAAQRASGYLDISWNDAVKLYAHEPPKAAFKWCDVLSTQELKLSKCPLNAPQKYSRKLSVPLPLTFDPLNPVSTQASAGEGEGDVLDAGDSGSMKKPKLEMSVGTF